MYFLIVFILLIFIFQIIEKSRFLKIRNSSTKTSAKIIEFRKEKIQSLRNDYTKIYYSYISINNETELHRLSNANSWGKKYKINETIEVFNYGDKWIDWNTYNKGFYKLIPHFKFRFLRKSKIRRSQ